jgi:hypothetical protein
MPNPHMQIQDKHAKEKEQQAKLAAIRFENMINKQMETKPGRDFVKYVLDKLGYMQNIMDTNASVYGKTAKQAVANDISRDIKKICPELFMQMEGEEL